MNPKPPKPNADLNARRSPVAPAVYRPQPLPQVLQRKTSQTRAQVQPWPARTVQLAQEAPQPPPQQPPVAGGKRKIGGLSDEEAAKRRASKFAADNKAAQVDKNKKLQLIEALKEKVRDFERDVADGSVVYNCHPKARKHQYPNPIATFKSAFEEAGFERLEARQGPLGFEITVRLGGNETVTGSYAGRVFTVIHCGEVQGGVGYGTPLGGQD
jgi:hypothetical protein